MKEEFRRQRSTRIRKVLDCASPLALWKLDETVTPSKSGRGLPHSKTLRARHPPSSILVASKRSEDGFHSRFFIIGQFVIMRRFSSASPPPAYPCNRR